MAIAVTATLEAIRERFRADAAAGSCPTLCDDGTG
jgi:hypothetical protein